MFFHRPVRPMDAPQAGTLRRRFDARRLPPGLTQAIGHIRDKKCRKLLGANLDEGRDGPLRHLIVRSDALAYALGVPGHATDDAARVLFLDGGMREAPVSAYELLDLRTRDAATRP
jgi:hypothetical protein